MVDHRVDELPFPWTRLRPGATVPSPEWRREEHAAMAAAYSLPLGGEEDLVSTESFPAQVLRALKGLFT